MKNYLTQSSARAVVYCLAVLLMAAGCKGVEVRSVHTSNTPEGSTAQADLKGLPVETLQYIEEKYPPESWAYTPNARVAIGPVLLSQEVRARLETRTGRSVVLRAQGPLVVQSPGRDTRLFLDEQHSQQAQAVLVEVFSGVSGFKVAALDDPTSLAFYKKTLTYDDLSAMGLGYIVLGTVAENAEGDEPLRVYVRFVDVITREIISAASGTGPDLDTATRRAATALINRIAQS